MSKHLSRLAAPKSWPIKRKFRKWVTKPSAGPHSLKTSIPMNVLLKEILNYAKTTKEVKKSLNNILINKIQRKDHKFPVGLFDIIEFPELKEYYTLIFDKKGKFNIIKIDKEDAQNKIYKIIGKKILKNKKIQINLYDGTNIIVKKDQYRVGDSIIVKDKQIIKHLKLEKDAIIFIIGGKYIGSTGVVESITKGNPLQKSTIIFKHKNNLIKTIKDYAFVIEKPFEK
jgi:small subunit ribosomal protein S4e